MRKRLVAAIFLLVIFAAAPWIYLNGKYGMYNIPHEDLMMWNFQLTYGILVSLIALGIIAAFSGSGEPEAPEPIVEEPVESPTEEPAEAHLEVEPMTFPGDEQTEEEAPTEETAESPPEIQVPKEWEEKEWE